MFSSDRSTRFLLPTLGAAFVVGGLLLLDVLPAPGYVVVIAAIGLVVALAGALLTRTAKIDLTWLRSHPALEVWLPLLAMALPVGLFEAVFFRGFIQNRLEASFGLVPAVAGAAGLYGLYHVGYGMGLNEIAFLAGLGIVYAVAFRVAGSILVLWPLLTPLGSLFDQIQGGDIVMPMESILGFADVAVLMLAAIWFARRHERRRGAEQATTAHTPGGGVRAGLGIRPSR